MEHKKILEDLNKQKIEKIEEYLRTKQPLKDNDKQKLEEAKNNWQASWSKYLDVLTYLETLEI